MQKLLSNNVKLNTRLQSFKCNETEMSERVDDLRLKIKQTQIVTSKMKRKQREEEITALQIPQKVKVTIERTRLRGGE
jgi:hypothetical protein